VREPEKRLGSKEDAKEITRHPFFEGIDWQKLFNREYKPPFNPGVVSVSPFSPFLSIPHPHILTISEFS